MRDTRDFQESERKELTHSNSKIISWRESWEEFNYEKEKWEKKTLIICKIYREGSKNQPLNLGECNDGSKFTAVNQAINQAKEYVDCCNKNNW